MSTYKGIFGKTIKHLSSDPDNLTYEGQIWYNTTEGKFKTVVATAAFSSGGPLSVGRHVLAGAGTQTSGLVFGGYTTVNVNSTEEYNGSGWAAGGDLNTARRGLGGCGTQTAGLAFGGYTTTKVTSTEEYDGSSWTTSPNSMSTARNDIGDNCGIQTAALAFGGETSTKVANTEEYDGTSWTAGGDLNTARADFAGAGTQTAGLGFAGNTPPKTAATEEYNGTAWTTVNSMNTARTSLSGGGLQTSAIAMGGLTPSASNATELYDGTTWTTSPATMATARGNTAASAANNTAALVCGGPSQTTSTEEFNFTANTITAAAWASANPMPSAQSGSGGTGNTTSGLVGPGDTGGTYPSWPARTLEFDGTNWSSGGDYYAAGTAIGFCGGTHAEMMGVGINKNGPVENTGATYDGSTWTTISTNYPLSIADMWAAGTNTASIWFGGGTGPFGGNPVQTGANSWNGSSWTAETALPESRNSHRSAGTSTLLVAWGASGPAAAPQSSSIEYNGTSWSAGGDLVKNFQGGGGAGTQTSAFAFQPSVSPQTVTCQYDGTAWATSASNTTSRPNAAAFGTSTSSAIIGGYYPNIGTTEEFTGETVALNIESVDNS
jgi:hypothetical protein